VLPDWDFDGDDGKRRAFIAWVNAELDRWAVLVTERFRTTAPPPPDWAEVAREAALAPRPAGAPSKTQAHRAGDGMDAAVWDYMLLRHMFRRYWPARNRRVTDPAHAARIAAQRNRHELRKVLDLRAWDAVATDQDKAAEVHAAWKRWDDIPGRRMAEADIAFLDSLPDQYFAQ
jgi:hypothetical protein